MTALLPLLPWLLAAVGLAVPAPASDGPQEGPDQPSRDEAALTLAALYRNTPSGARHLEGIREAVAAHDLCGSVRVEANPYVDERAGDAALLALVQDPGIDIVLGPTDSGVFLRGKALQDELPRRVPVISSLITVKEENGANDWFLRTNVDVVKRAGAVYDHLNKRWVTSIAVLYTDSEFGRRAEQAFRSNLRGLQTGLYSAYPFDPPDVRAQLWEVLERRPEALGIFGEREDIVSCTAALATMNEESSSYHPIFFTVFDIRSLWNEVDDFVYVSVIRPVAGAPGAPIAPVPAADMPDNVAGLAFDTTLLVLDTVQRSGLESGFDPVDFRARFVTNVLGGASGARGTRTDMRFVSRENDAELYLYELRDGQVVHHPAADVPLLTKFGHKVELVFLRFGFWPLGVGLVMLLTVVFSSIQDIHRWYGGRIRDLLLTPRFVALVAIQGAVAASLFLFLGETGRIRHDSVLTGFLIALTPSPLLRASFAKFGGWNVGLADLYDQVLRGLTKGLLLARYAQPEVNVRVIAYYNSAGFLRSTLLRIYRRSPNQEEASRMVSALDSELAEAADNFQYRLVCARRLIQIRTWEELYELGCVPKRMYKKLEDPGTWIAASVRYCLKRTDLTQKVEILLQELLAGHSATVREHCEKKLQDAGDSPRDVLYAKIQFLVMRFDYDEEDLIRKGLLDVPVKGGASIPAPAEPPEDEPVHLLPQPERAEAAAGAAGADEPTSRG